LVNIEGIYGELYVRVWGNRLWATMSLFFQFWHGLLSLFCASH